MKPDIGSESRFLPTPSAFDAPVKGFGIDMPFGVEKLQWLGYPKVKKIGRYLYSFLQNPRTCQTDTHRQTDRQTDPHDNKSRACIASRGKNRTLVVCTLALGISIQINSISF